MPLDPIVVTIPGTPDKSLSPNNVRSERHWGPRRKATRQARKDAYYVARNANVEMAGLSPPIILHAVIAWERTGRGYRRGYDPDAAHAMLKPHIDDKHITLASVQQERDADGRGYVRIAIECGKDANP